MIKTVFYVPQERLQEIEETGMGYHVMCKTDAEPSEYNHIVILSNGLCISYNNSITGIADILYPSDSTDPSDTTENPRDAFSKHSELLGDDSNFFKQLYRESDEGPMHGHAIEKHKIDEKAWSNILLSYTPMSSIVSLLPGPFTYNKWQKGLAYPLIQNMLLKKDIIAYRYCFSQNDPRYIKSANPSPCGNICGTLTKMTYLTGA